MNHLLKFGFHDFLNAQPLLETLREKAEEGNYELILDSPSAIARMLDTGELDLGMIPSIEFLKNENRYKLLSPLIIASKGSVDTVLFITKKNLSDIQTIALDERSRTSATLVKLLFQDRWGSNVHFETLAPEPVAQLQTFDAVLIIGDKAFDARKRLNHYFVYDLSLEWHSQTEKPFVHAVLATRNDSVIPETLSTIFEEALNRAPETISKIASTHAGRLNISVTQCEDYLKNKILYKFDPETRSGLNHFQTLCLQNGFIH